MNLDDIQQIFFQECEEGLAAMEVGFATLRRGEHDPETINTIFRSVHSIKGGAGAFGHERLQAYTHQYETLLDQVRNGSLELSSGLLDTIIAAFDLLTDHVAAARDGGGSPADTAMLDRLAAAAARPSAPAASPVAPVEPVEPVEPVGQGSASGVADDFDDLFAMLSFDEPAADAVVRPAWRLSLRPDARALANGGDPLLLLRELVMLGADVIDVDTALLPSLRAIEAGRSYLGWTMSLPGEVAEDDIRAVLEFMDRDEFRLERDGDASAQDLEPDPAPEMSVPDAVVAKPAEPVVAAVVPAVVPALAAVPAPPVEAAPPANRAAPSPAAQTIRVDLDKLDRLVNLVGELVITQAMLAQRLSEHGLTALSELTELDHLTRELQDSTMTIRAQPMKTVFSRVPRIIRELELETGKRVRLDVEGEMTEVDKTVVERIGEPLTHLIRNAVDHGLETPEDRAASGKPEEGVVRLAAAHQAGRIVITVADDGRGIDRARVRTKAVERGIVAADAALTDEEIDNLIFAPGFSTAASVSNISGRGVGMDVVRKNVQALGGRIGIQSRQGHGSSFSMSLPLTLAVLDGMIVMVGDQTFVIPLTHIVESLRPTSAEVKTMGPARALLDVRGTYVPIQRVADQLAILGAETDPSKAVLIVVESDHGQAVLMVDSIQDQRQVVVKSLETNYQVIDGLAGATILGDGRVALILDIDTLISRWRRSGQGGVPPVDMAA